MRPQGKGASLPGNAPEKTTKITGDDSITGDPLLQITHGELSTLKDAPEEVIEGQNQYLKQYRDEGENELAEETETLIREYTALIAKLTEAARYCAKCRRRFESLIIAAGERCLCDERFEAEEERKP